MSFPPTQPGFASMFAECVKREPERRYFSFEGVSYSFRQTELVMRNACAWLAQLGAVPGDRVAVMLETSPFHIALILAMASSGLTWVPINPRQRKDGLRYILDESRPRFIVAERAFSDVLVDAGITATDPRLVLLLEGGIPEIGDAPLVKATAATNRSFAIMYTSGTTGPPKGVMITPVMMRYAAEAVALLTEPRSGDVMFMWEPLIHIGGAQMLLLPLIRPVSLAVVSRFSVSRFWQQVIEARATHIHYLGGILNMLLSNAPSDADRAHSVRIAWGAGCQVGMWQQFQDRFGIRVRECYGMSEGASITTVNITEVVGSIGTALPWYDVQICDEHGEPMPVGSPGEIVVTARVEGPLFGGYYQNESATAHALRGGRLHTGDFAKADADGNFYFLGRMGDNVRHKGENVSAWEVEGVANKHRAVECSAMLGVPSPLGEQDIALFVQPVEGAVFDMAEFAGWLSHELAPFQMPRYIQLVTSFARTPSERIMKHKLRVDPSRCWDRLSQEVRGTTLRRGLR